MFLKIITAFFLISFSVSGVLAQKTPTDEKQLNEKIDNYLKQYFKEVNPGGSVLIAKNNKVLYKRGFGIADLEMNVANNPATVFRLGSITKQFTAIAILQLVEKGQLSLQDSVQKFIIDFPAKGHPITVEHLLTHTSGIKEFLAMDHSDPFVLRREFSPKEIIDFFMNEPLEFTSGTQYSYSNSGYIILGYIIENITGEPYAKYIGENLLLPSGMKNTYYADYRAVIPHRAKGYQVWNERYINSEFISMSIPYAAGGLLSTVEDLFLWHKALYNNQLLKKDFLEKAFTPFKLTNGYNAPYGFGWFLNNEIAGKKTIEHSGRISGFNTTQIYIPEEDIFVAVLMNIEDHALLHNSQITATDLSLLAMGKDLNPKIKIDSEIISSYTGEYKMKNSPRIASVKTEGNDLLFIENNGKLLLIPESETTFKVKGIKPEAMIKFLKDKDGKPEKLVISQGGVLYEWVKVK